MIGIDLFSGPGGMSLGAKMVGIDTKIAVENDRYAALTYAKNHKGVTVVVDNISSVNEFKFDRPKGEQLVLYGGPPCQGYSNSNQRTRGSDNPKNWLFKEFVRVAKLLEPDWIVIENVKGLVTQNSGYFFDMIIKDLQRLGYTISFKILNSMDFGVPQSRERVFIVGSLHGIAIQLPSNELIQQRVTVKDALDDLPGLANGNAINEMAYSGLPISEYAKRIRGGKRVVSNNYVTKNNPIVLARYRHIPQGGNWQHIPESLMSNYKDHNRCHHGIYRRLDPNAPSVVIGNYRKNMLIHPSQDRGLSVREAARIQSFPDSFEFYGPLISQQQQVGDAVPPALAKVVFERILETI